MSDQNPFLPPGAPAYGRSTPADGTGDPWRTGSAEVLDAGGSILPPAPRGRGRRGLAAALGAGAVVALVGGGAWVWSAVGGGGDQPEDHLPADVAAVAKIDLDPSVGQKIDALRFFAKFPLGRDVRVDEDTDLRRVVYENLTRGQEGAPAWSEVDPWLGDRAAVAVRADPAAPGTPVPLAVLEVTDEAKARASLQKAAEKDDDLAFVVAEGWATVSDTQAHASAAAQAARTAPLSGDAVFAADTAELGDAGILRAWYSGERTRGLVEAAAGATGQDGPAVQGLLSGYDSALRGHGAVALRFDGPALELAGRFAGDRDAARALARGGGRSGIEQLPDGTLAGIGVADAGPTLQQQWTSIEKQLAALPGNGSVLAEIEEQTGLDLPDDLVALLGERLTLAVAGPDAGGTPQVGLRVRSGSDRLPAALAKVDRLVEESGAVVERQDAEGGYVLATTPEQARALGRDGTLGSSDRFRDAVPDGASAPVVVYADVAGLLAAYGTDVPEKDRRSLEPLAALGMTAAADGDDAYGFSMRLTTR